MALTKPFVYNIGAFPASTSKTVTFGVLGGDTITAFEYYIYDNNSGSLVYDSGAINVSTADVGGDSIRTFSFSIDTSVGLTNNNTYYLLLKTYNYSEVPTLTSPFSSAALFTCYVAPSITIQKKSGSSYVDLNNGDTVTADFLDCKLIFNTNDNNSPAVLNDAKISLYGIDGASNETLLFAGDTLYVNPLTQEVEGFIPNVDSSNNLLNDALYQSYTLRVEAETVDGFAFTTQKTGLLCYYSQTSTGDVVTLSNNCVDGSVRIRVNATSTSSIVTANLQYKENTSSNWITFWTQDNPNAGTDAWLNFYLDFYFCGNNKLYDFRLVCYDSSNNVLSSYSAQILSTFNKPFICSQSKSYDLTNEWQADNVNTIQKSVVYEPFGSQFPFIAYNARTKYRSGTYVAVLLAPTSKSSTSSYLDRYAQVELVNEFNNFLCDKRPKILKDFNGNLRIVSVADPIQNQYYKELANGLASTTFSWVEISDFTESNMNRIGLFSNFNIIYN